MRPGPAERVRETLRGVAGTEAARGLPQGYQRVGRVLLLRLPESLRPHFRLVGESYRRELGVATVLRKTGPIEGEERRPNVETIAGGPTETTVIEHGIRYRFDASKLMFAAGNRRERQRLASLVRPGETVVDLFAGIGYFSLPAAKWGRAGMVVACEKNPVALHYLRENARLNRVESVLRVVEGDNRSADLPQRSVDRVFLGYLPTSLPWVPLALGLLKESGGWLHVHIVANSRHGLDEALRATRSAVETSLANVLGMSAREVKPYGPGRMHVVVDVNAVPRPAGA